jgi:hypothetical protein
MLLRYKGGSGNGGKTTVPFWQHLLYSPVEVASSSQKKALQ